VNTAPVRRTYDERGLLAALAALCDAAGLDPTNAQVIKFTNNAVFRLARQPIVVRIAGSGTARARVPNVVRVARWLEQHDLSAVRLLDSVAQPVVAGRHTATVWHAVPEDGPKPTATDLARWLRAFHHLPAPSPPLPTWSPLRGIRQRLTEATGLTDDDHDFLTRRCDQIDEALTQVQFVLPPGVVHGDATVANLIGGSHGAVMCDFDSTTVGPREWDLTPVAVGRHRFHVAADRQRALADGYGFDVTTWDGFSVLRQLRELQLVTSVVPILASQPSLIPQFQRRLRTVRTADSEATWEPYR